ncbi:MAG: DUF3750 domain-containing protein [Alphaproteobacteria bacterium]|jgi:hypothetical protein|nr:DUF3750 domain-containing protein [Alphaproteobacteria bacterium]MDP6813436.1 DUF3750 domain-containing protein [Alphaproteobacteria bacterium]
MALVGRLWRRWRRLVLLLFLGGTVFVALPLAYGAWTSYGEWSGTSDARHERRGGTGQAPDPATTREAVVQVYAARAARWRGAFASHTWLAVKPRDAEQYTRYEVWGWRHGERGGNTVRAIAGRADHYWFGYRPERLVDLRGAEAELAIRQLTRAIADYPAAKRYRIWPGPNSNTFVAHMGRRAPALRLDLPAHAIGKDFLADGGIFARAPSGTGWQLSLFGLFGILVALEEGIEVNLFSLNYGVDFQPPALRLPALGRLGWPPAAADG